MIIVNSCRSKDFRKFSGSPSIRLLTRMKLREHRRRRDTSTDSILIGLALVAATWAYITWRLGTLDAPDVDAFRSGHDEADATGASAGSAEVLPEDGEA